MKTADEDILSIPAIVLANLCVCYIMTSENEEAEELMHRTEKVHVYIHLHRCNIFNFGAT